MCVPSRLYNYDHRFFHATTFQFPDEPSAPICGAANNECVDEASRKLKKNLHSLWFTLNFSDEVLKRESDSYEDSDKCNCLPSCTSLVYNTEFSQAYYDWRAVFQALGKNSSEKGYCVFKS